MGKLITDLLEYCRHLDQQHDKQLWAACSRIAERLCQGAPVIDAEAFESQATERAFELIVRWVKQHIDANEPGAGLDRLHTFVMKYMRHICERHGIATHRDTPLHSLVGEYVKHMKSNGRIESEMTERILKSSISIMEAFNRVRNEQSLAHDNPILNYNESLLIFNHVASAIRFVGAMEREETDAEQQEPAVEDGEMLF